MYKQSTSDDSYVHFNAFDAMLLVYVLTAFVMIAVTWFNTGA